MNCIGVRDKLKGHNLQTGLEQVAELLHSVYVSLDKYIRLRATGTVSILMHIINSAENFK